MPKNIALKKALFPEYRQHDHQAPSVPVIGVNDPTQPSSSASIAHVAQEATPKLPVLSEKEKSPDSPYINQGFLNKDYGEKD